MAAGIAGCLDRLGDVVEQLLQRSERTEPQPQNGPRPQNRSPAAIEAQSRKISGADRKYSQLKPVSSELAKVRTLTTES